MNQRFYISVAEALHLEWLEDIEDAIQEQEEAAEAYMAAYRAEADEDCDDAIRASLARLWDEATSEAWDAYSDLFKDLYGVRPTWKREHFFCDRT